MTAIEFATTSHDRAVRLPRVCELTGVSRATIWRWVKNDQSFPQPFSLSEGVTVWYEGEVLQWLDEKKEQRVTGKTPSRKEAAS